MPSFSEYLFAPWKIIGALFASGTPGTPGQPGTPGGPLCSYQDLGGQIMHVCNVGGYSMPAFIFWASFLIFLLFAGTSVWLFIECNRISLLFRTLTKQLERLPAPKSGKMTSQDLSALRHLMQKHGPIAPVWDLFEETLLDAGSGETEEFFSTQSVETIFSKSALIEDNIHSALFNAIPGILTGVGLLMTFVAILDGLSHVSVGANMDVQGIGGLINGLSGKFVSSIVAVTCAVFFVFVERTAYAQPHEAYRKLIQKLSARFKRKTTEQLLNQVNLQLIRLQQLQTGGHAERSSHSRSG